MASTPFAHVYYQYLRERQRQHAPLLTVLDERRCYQRCYQKSAVEDQRPSSGPRLGCFRQMARLLPFEHRDEFLERTQTRQRPHNKGRWWCMEIQNQEIEITQPTIAIHGDGGKWKVLTIQPGDTVTLTG